MLENHANHTNHVNHVDHVNHASAISREGSLLTFSAGRFLLLRMCSLFLSSFIFAMHAPAVRFFRASNLFIACRTIYFFFACQPPHSTSYESILFSFCHFWFELQTSKLNVHGLFVFKYKKKLRKTVTHTPRRGMTNTYLHT